MDLTLEDDQTDIVGLADQILDDHATPERAKEVERSTGEDVELWTLLVDAGLVGLSLPERAGGSGRGLLDSGLVAQRIGAHVAAVPLVEVVAVGRALARAGDTAASSVAGGAIIRPALAEPPIGASGDPATLASSSGDGWRLVGDKIDVGGPPGDDYLVSARTDDGPALFLVSAADVDETVNASSTGAPVLTLRLRDSEARLVASGREALDTLILELHVLRCAVQAGVVRGALDLAAGYCSEREQFGSKIGTFQAVAHRLADAWLDANAVEMTARQAAWRLDNGLPPEQAAASAGFWACEGAHRIVHAAQHVHGGIGVDTDYPVHRHFRWAKRLELALGSGSRNLSVLGDRVADEGLTIC